MSEFASEDLLEVLKEICNPSQGNGCPNNCMQNPIYVNNNMGYKIKIECINGVLLGLALTPAGPCKRYSEKSITNALLNDALKEIWDGVIVKNVKKDYKTIYDKALIKGRSNKCKNLMKVQIINENQNLSAELDME